MLLNFHPIIGIAGPFTSNHGRCSRHRLPRIATGRFRRCGGVGVGAALRPPGIVPPALNEEFAATALLGSQLASSQPDARYEGVLGIWYGKAPGVDRATDAFRHAVYGGTTPLGGVVGAPRLIGSRARAA